MTESVDRPERTDYLREGRERFAQARPSAVWLLVGLGSLVVAGGLLFVPDIREGNRDIARLELVGNAADAAGLGLDHVILGLLLDVFVIIGYALVLRWAALFFGRLYRLHLARDTWRRRVAQLVLVAAALDVVEDVLLMWGVASDYAESWWIAWVWPAAAVVSWGKWLLLVVVAVYVGGALLIALSGPWLRTPGQAWGRLTSFASLLWSDPPHERETMTTRLAADQHRKFGIALSGGGIRASSITLGALQVLEGEADGDRIGWGHADAVTAISGGSNMASAWSISRSAIEVDGALFGPNSPTAWAAENDESAMTLEERHLLLNLGYLVARSPRGDADDPISPYPPSTDETAPPDEDPTTTPPVTPTEVVAASAAPSRVASTRPSAYATVFTGFVINAAVLLLTLWLITQPVGRLFGWFASAPFPCGFTGLFPSGPEEQFECVKGSPLLVRPALITLALGLVGIVLWVLLAKLLKGASPVLKVARAAATGLLAAGAFLLVALVLFPYAMWAVGSVTSGGASLGSAVAALGSLGAVARILMKPAAKFAPVLGGVVFFALLVFLAAYWSYGAATTTDDVLLDFWSLHGLGWWLVALAVLLAVHLGATPEWWSLAGFYRGKLRLAYATYRVRPPSGPEVLRTYKNDDEIESPDDVREPAFHAFVPREANPEGTPLTVCTTATVSNRSVRTHYNIPAMSTTITPDRVTMFVPLDDQGQFGEWSCDAEHLDSVRARKGTPRLTTMLSIAISSAAVSPAMGKFRIGPTSMLLTFANIRLGVWMPNPRYARYAEHGVPFPRVRLPYLLKEFAGLHDPSDAYVYLTDGGHWENTGLVELLRKGDFREIVCIDADPGPGDAVKSVSEAIDLAALECAAKVSLNLDPMRASPPSSRKPEYSERSVNVGIFQLANGRVGVLWYAKPALVTDMPAALLAFRETHPSFPRVSTLNQFFDTSTFVAYRNLGRFNARVIRGARTELVTALTRYTNFGAFANIEEPHWAVKEIAEQVKRIEHDVRGRQRLYDLVRAALT